MLTWRERSRNQRIRRNVKLACFVAVMLLVFAGLAVLTGCLSDNLGPGPIQPSETEEEQETNR